jgi:hypothetical protein
MQNLLHYTDALYVIRTNLREQTTIISLHNTKRFVFATDAEGVYCAVRAECLNTIHVIFLFVTVKFEKFSIPPSSYRVYLQGKSCIFHVLYPVACKLYQA